MWDQDSSRQAGPCWRKGTPRCMRRRGSRDERTTAGTQQLRKGSRCWARRDERTAAGAFARTVARPKYSAYTSQYKFKKTYGGTPEPQTPQDAPWLRGPSLNIPYYRYSPAWHGQTLVADLGNYLVSSYDTLSLARALAHLTDPMVTFSGMAVCGWHLQQFQNT